MQDTTIIYILVGLVLLILMVGVTTKPLKLVKNILSKIVIAALLLFFLNVCVNQFGIYVPINFVTVGISAALGIPGICSLVAIDYFLI